MDYSLVTRNYNYYHAIKHLRLLLLNNTGIYSDTDIFINLLASPPLCGK